MLKSFNPELQLKDTESAIRNTLNNLLTELKRFKFVKTKYNPVTGRSYIKLPKQLGHPKKVWITNQNINDNECFKWCLVRYLDPADHHPARITKVDEDFARKLDFKDIKLPSKLEIFTKLKKSVFSYAKKKKIQPMC